MFANLTIFILLGPQLLHPASRQVNGKTLDGENPWKSNGHKTKRTSAATAIALSSGCQKTADSFTNLGIISV
jgi:hypothetical protein